MGTGSIRVVGGGLAGVEAAYQISKRGGRVLLYEMRPFKKTPVHKTPLLGELVCSNSLKSDDIENASGLLKRELSILGSFVLSCAYKSKIPAGKALAVERNLFALYLSDGILSNSLVEFIPKEFKDLDDNVTTIIATGPLTSEDLSKSIMKILGENYFYFYDATSPIIDGSTIDFSKGFWGSRYGRGGDDYFNIPLDKELYEKLMDEIIKGEKVEEKDFENLKSFEGCKPIEDLIERGRETLRFGPMRPVGLKDPRTGREPYAVIQLRREDREGRLFSMVGFQTRLKWGEQKRIFRMIPGLENAEFLRFGYLHRNSFINAPRHLNKFLQLKEKSNIFLGGQITGVEGYLESVATGLIAGINALRYERGMDLVTPPETTIIGSLIKYITESDERDFQPMNANFGLLPPLEERCRKRERKRLLAERAIKDMKRWFKENVEGGL